MKAEALPIPQSLRQVANNIIVEGLPPDSSSEDLYEMFGEWGEILSVAVVCGPLEQDPCSASIHMATKMDADRVMMRLRRLSFCHEREIHEA